MNKPKQHKNDKKKAIVKVSKNSAEEQSAGVLSLPIRARIEVSRFCNLKCPSCPMGRNKITNKALMSYGNFKKIIKLINSTVREVALFNYGEPLLNPEIAKMIKFAKANKIETIGFHSNGLLLNKKMSRELVKSGLDYINISIDGASNDTYKKYRAGGNLDILLKNIKELVNIRKSLGVKNPTVIAQFVVMKHNQHEIDKFSEICNNIGVDEVVFKTFNAYMSGYEDRERNLKFVPTNTGYTRYKTTKAKEVSSGYKLNRCTWPWENLLVNANGDIALCYHDYNADYNLGNILRDRNWWDNENRRRILNDMANGKGKIKMCKHCSVPGSIE